jgi:Ser-tRNA(Ala) deacylase AlaX
MTELAYVSAPDETVINAHVLDIETRDGQVALVLDRTPFYPQGGGQPSDVGTIEGTGFTFAVRKAVLVDGVVRHEGIAVDGTPVLGVARAEIDTERRRLHARLHTGGHLIMTAVFDVTGMRAVKGYHFPDGPYVEFDGVIADDDKERTQAALQQRLDEMVAAESPIGVELTTVADLIAAGVFMPMEIPTDKPTRVVTTFGFRSPCGGTHVSNSGDLAGLRVRGVKSKSGHTRVSYEIAGNGRPEGA